MKSVFVLLIFVFICTSSFAQMGSKPTFPKGEASRQGKLPDTVVVACISFNEDTEVVYVNRLCSLYDHTKPKNTSPSLFTKENVKDIFVLLTHVDSNKLLITDTDYSLLRFLRLKTVLNDLSFSVYDSTEHFVNDEEYRVITWDEGIPLKIFENDSVYNTKFYDWKEFWECSEKLDYAPALPYAVPIPTALIKKYKLEDFEFDYISEWFHPNFVLSIIPLKSENIEWLDDLEGSTCETSNDLLEEQVSNTEIILSEGIDLNKDNVIDAFWYIEKGSGNLVEWYVKLYLNIEGEWTPMWFQYFNEFY